MSNKVSESHRDFFDYNVRGILKEGEDIYINTICSPLLLCSRRVKCKRYLKEND